MHLARLSQYDNFSIKTLLHLRFLPRNSIIQGCAEVATSYDFIAILVQFVSTKRQCTSIS